MGLSSGRGATLTEEAILVNYVRVATKQRIVDAGLLTFGRYGYRQASMEAVAEQAALSRQALYRHFPTKEALFAAVVGELHESALAAGAGAAEEARRKGADAAGVLLAQLEARSATLLARLQGSPHAEELQDENSRQCGAIAAEAGRRFVAQLAATIRTERRSGRLALPRGLAAGELAESLVAAARGIKTAVPPRSPDAFRRELARMVRWLVAGASGPGAPARRRGRAGDGVH
jgi:AcrR family transcriptional regulator